MEFTVNHIAFIARFSSLSSVGSIHFKLIPIRISSPVYNRDLDTHLEIMWEIKHVGDFFSLSSPLTSFFFFCNSCCYFVEKKKEGGAFRSVTRLSRCLSVCITVQRSFFLMGSTARPEIHSRILTNNAACSIIALKKDCKYLVQFCNNEKKNITTIVFSLAAA